MIIVSILPSCNRDDNECPQSHPLLRGVHNFGGTLSAEMGIINSNCCLLFILLMNSEPPIANAAASQPTLNNHQPSAFLHSILSAKMKPYYLNPSDNLEGDKSPRNNSASSKRSRQQSPEGRSKLKQQSQTSFRPKTGLSDMLCPPLDGPVGAPPLPVLTTKDPRVIERWLVDNVNNNNGNEYTILGYDQETIAKPPWMPERALLPDGPATIQLSTPTSSIIFQLSLCGDGSAQFAPEVLRRIINNPKVIKVGVGLDDDALELYRWSKESLSSSQPQQLWEMASRLDIGCILGAPNDRRAGLKELAQKVLGVDLIKSKKLSMSNWGLRNLSLEQIHYAARDAWVSAAIIDHLQKSNNHNFQVETMMEMEFMSSQRKMDDLDARAKLRRTAKMELKDIIEGEGSNMIKGKEREERMGTLQKLMDKYRPDKPPSFSEDILNLSSILEINN